MLVKDLTIGTSNVDNESLSLYIDNDVTEGDEKERSQMYKV